MKHKVPVGYILAALMVPSIAMIGTRYMGQGASQSQAGVVKFETPKLAAFPSISLASSNEGVELGSIPEISSPFWFQEVIDDLYVNPIQIDDPYQPQQTQNLIPDFQVTTILPHPKRPLAIIDSKPRKIGDEVAEGWELIAINGQNRTVLLVHKSGKRITLGLAKKP